LAFEEQTRGVHPVPARKVAGSRADLSGDSAAKILEGGIRQKNGLFKKIEDLRQLGGTC